jgi:DeoR family deoxyribose operon repressor
LGLKAQQRIAELLDRLGGGRIVALSDAASLFGVSEMTIRRDVASSASRLAVLGGYVVANADRESLYALEREQGSHEAAKVTACEHALALIEPEDTIFIDSGTTLVHLAARLPADLNLTAVCFSMNIATVLAKNTGIRWLIAGGLYNRPTASFSGDHGPGLLRTLRLNKAFISAGGVHLRLGVSCADFSEVAMKRAAIRNAMTSYLVVDSSKFETVKPAFFAKRSEFAGIISENGLNLVDAEDTGEEVRGNEVFVTHWQ